MVICGEGRLKVMHGWTTTELSLTTDEISALNCAITNQYY